MLQVNHLKWAKSGIGSMDTPQCLYMMQVCTWCIYLFLAAFLKLFINICIRRFSQKAHITGQCLYSLAGLKQLPHVSSCTFKSKRMFKWFICEPLYVVSLKRTDDEWSFISTPHNAIFMLIICTKCWVIKNTSINYCNCIVKELCSWMPNLGAAVH